MNTDTSSQTKINVNLELQEPPMFRVVYINDNKTSIEFVIDSLITYFSYTADTAMVITKTIHDTGSAVVAVLPFEIAEQKGVEITLAARANGFPLQIRLEPEVG
jgi:ATP-dependent Clp protease adaptor protein ClpS